jgi:antagonist of KipI
VAIVETLEIVAPGPLTTVQDNGRFGYGRYGVPPSGALDTFSMRIANLLVGNSENEACLEITLFGLKIEILTDITIAFAGADLQVYCNDKSLNICTSYRLKKGGILSFRGIRGGCRSYLAVGGGLYLPEVMGSKSTNLSSRFGGLEGRSLQKGDILFTISPHLHLNSVGKSFPQTKTPLYSNEWNLRVIFGPQDNQFTQKSKKTFINSPYRVSPHSDRMGIRLTGPIIERSPELDESIISEGVISGTVQVPGDAQPIIILSEIVTGGYRKIATVISADLPKAGQMKPGDTVWFEQVSLDTAYEVLQEMEEEITKFRAST